MKQNTKKFNSNYFVGGKNTVKQVKFVSFERWIE
jgi:hypothetical protein